MTWRWQQRGSRLELEAKLFLIGFAEVKMSCTGEYQVPVSSRDGKVNVEAMSCGHRVREGSHRGLC